MKLFLVIDEMKFYQPQFVADFLSRTTDEVVGAALVTKIPVKNSLEHYLLRHFYYLRPLEIIKLIYFQITSPLSVRSVFQKYSVDFFEVENNINQEKYLSKIKKKKPDVIISSNSLYFKNEILSIPKICSLNRHSALLPSYGGLWPVFQAARYGEKYTGVSVHLMVNKIDKGGVLIQIKIPIKKNDSISNLYKLAYAKSSKVLLDALNKVRKGDFKPIGYNKNKPSYFSFPTREDWLEFRKRDGKFI